MHDDETRLQKHLDERPEDEANRMVLADLLEETGQAEAAACQRWLARQHKWPDRDLGVFHLNGWHWWRCPDQPERLRAHAVLLREAQVHMPAGEWLFKTRAEAEAALAQALAKAGLQA